MTVTDFLDPDRPDGVHGPDGTDSGEEEELRVLLQRAAPHLAAPEDRIERVLARAGRTRRRRRAAGLGAGLTGGLLAAALAAAPAIAPAPDATGALGAAGTPATAPSAATAAPSATPEPEGPDPVGPLGTAISFGSGPDMVVNVPKGWLTQANGWAQPDVTIGTLANQPLVEPTACEGRKTLCLPVGQLRGSGVVVTFRLVKDPSRIKEYADQSRPAQAAAVGKECTTVGGTAELVGYRTVASGPAPAVIELTACLREPTTAVVQQVQQVLESVRPLERTSTPSEDPSG
ncbi:hypothetical protein PUR71_13210 [Streptomyces sp. SP17BM10]|uniref:hypothetical protein n=1 Tax=Streptomyces sp. SP17BM10 TaxID=3002530 RepID=UPI002E78E488|nr:hypothetical protein [Streptomyces sp. SP17BM10]MEE1783859.1 hypothetical protein [Streptomyces sp. SP17BM10]